MTYLEAKAEILALEALTCPICSLFYFRTRQQITVCRPCERRIMRACKANVDRMRLALGEHLDVDQEVQRL